VVWPLPSRRLAGLLLFPALLAAGCLSPRGTAERPAVRSLELQGARAVPAEESLSRIATHPSGRWFWQDRAP
jgi:hypothetical protein